MSRTDRLIAQARARTGLRDFGDDSFREGLEVLVNAVEAETDPAHFRIGGFYAQIIRHLCNRLEIEDWYRRYPEIEGEEIVQPLFGLGLPRTGSTVLTSLLCLDPGFRSLRRWEAARPCPPPQATTDPTDPRIALTCAAFEMIDRRAPAYKIMIPWSADQPAECIELMALDFKSYFFQVFVHSPSYQEWFLNCDMTSAYRFHKRVLKMLQWRHPPKRWQLKSPTHMFSIHALHEVYPDARFWMTHRDPARAIPSIASLELELQRVYSDQRAPDYGRFSANRWAIGLQRLIAFRDRFGESRFFDVKFSEMRANMMDSVRRLYQWIGRPLSEQVSQLMRDWLEQHPEGKHGSHVYEPEDYGVTAQWLREQFRFYIQRFDVLRDQDSA